MPFHQLRLRAIFVAFILPTSCVALSPSLALGKGPIKQYKRSAPVAWSRQNANTDDAALRSRLRDYGVEAIDTPEQDRRHVALGQLLFFDRIICGNKDTACATCHHPLTNTTDSLALGVGTG